MIRVWMIILGIGLLVLWLTGLGSHSTGWVMWLDFVDGFVSIAFGITAPRVAESNRASRVSAPLVLAIGLYLIWIIGLAAGQASWKDWWTFAFACAYLLLSIAASSKRRVPTSPPRVA